MDETTGIEPEEVAELEESTPSEEIEETPVDDPTAQPEEEEQKKTPKGVQKRIDELVKQREEERRRAERYEQMLAEMYKGKQEPKKEEPQPFQPTTPKPTLEQFEYDSDKYQEAVIEWKWQQLEAQRLHQTKQQQEQQQRQQYQQSLQGAARKIVEAGREKYEDFNIVDEVGGIFTDDNMVYSVARTKNPGDVAYFLAKNPEEGRRIAQLDPISRGIELGHIDAKIAAVPPKKTTSAPEPVKPVGTRGTVQAEPDPAKDPEAWIKWERERVKKLGRRY